MKALLVLLAACSATPAKPTPKPATGTAVVCTKATAKPPASLESRRAPADGGYRRLDDPARNTLRGEIAAHPAEGTATLDARGVFDALDAALHDLRSELNECLRQARAKPGQHFTLRVRVVGASAIGSLADKVEVKQLAAQPAVEVLEVPTPAEACIAQILELVELPPSPGTCELAKMLTYDECLTR
jgi:hypothetical protein